MRRRWELITVVGIGIKIRVRTRIRTGIGIRRIRARDLFDFSTTMGTGRM